MSSASLTDQIVNEIEGGLAFQRHKWAAQCQAHALSMTNFHVLSVLEAEGPIPMSRLSDQLGMTFSNVTGIVGRMEERGLVERVHDDADRRVVLARITPDGRQVISEVEGIRLEHLRRLVEALSRDEQRTVLAALKIMTAAKARLHGAARADTAKDLSTATLTTEQLPA